MAEAHRLNISIPEKDYLALQDKAHTCGVTMSWLARQAMLEFIARHRDKDLRLPLVTPEGELVERN